VRIAGFEGWIVLVGTGDTSDVDLVIELRWIDHEIPGSHLVNETEELSGIVGYRAGLTLRIRLGNLVFEGVTVLEGLKFPSLPSQAQRNSS